MTDTTAALARSITLAGSKQTYFTIRLLVDKGLANDCYRAYAYFRWADDVIDLHIHSDDERIAFIGRQRILIDHLYRGERPDGLAPEEAMIADLISHDRRTNTGLHSFIYNFLAILEFDAHRKGRLISQRELMWYSNCLAKAVTDGIQYFIGHCHPHLAGKGRYLASTAAHIAHMLRDMLPDTVDGFINIPHEVLEAHGISPGDVDSPEFRAWVRERVELAQRYLREGKRYLDELAILRCKLAGYWYCTRFDGLLEAIEREEYVLRAVYNERYKLSAWLRFIWVGVTVTARHFARQGLASLTARPATRPNVREGT